MNSKTTGRAVPLVAAAALLGLALTGCVPTFLQQGRAHPTASAGAGGGDSIIEPTQTAQAQGPAIVEPTDNGAAAAPTRAPAKRKVNASLYSDGADRYFFQTETGKHICSTEAGYASCTSFSFPKGAPKVSAPGDPGFKILPDSIEVSYGHKASLWRSSDPANALGGYVTQDHKVKNRVLPYGSVLAVRGASCTVEQDTGVTCKTTDHGFQLSSESYKLW